MRCPFCHNWEIVDASSPAVMDEEELFKFLEGRKGLLDGVAFTGGEPLLRKELPEIMKRVRDMGFMIKLDTNGNHPDELVRVVEAGLVDYVAMDIKNSPERYGETIGLPGFDISKIRENIDYLISKGNQSGSKSDEQDKPSTDKSSDFGYEFRTTVVKQFHDEDSFRGIAELIKGADKYFLQGFVDRDTVPFSGLQGVSEDKMKCFSDIVRPYVNSVEIRGF